MWGRTERLSHQSDMILDVIHNEAFRLYAVLDPEFDSSGMMAFNLGLPQRSAIHGAINTRWNSLVFADLLR